MDYKTMYYTLFTACSNVIDCLIAAQQHTEELAMQQDTPLLSISEEEDKPSCS